MALANIAVLLSQMGKRVLVVDWDLEAPGLERYFTEYLFSKDQEKPGLLDLFLDVRNCYPDAPDMNWRKLVKETKSIQGHPISLISSGRKDGGDYVSWVLGFNWREFFSDFDGGEYIERLRDEWREEFDFILVDSRTGITDIGGICTIHMPDILILIFTANSQSIDGTKDVAKRIQKAHQDIAYDREQLLAFPLLSRYDDRAEFERSQRWLDYAAAELEEFYDWLPKEYTPLDFLEQTKLPYIAHFSFGENLTVFEQRTTDPGGLSFSYQRVAELLSNEFSLETLQRLFSDGILSEDIVDLSQTLTRKELQEIKERLIEKPETVSSQLGMFNISIAQGSEIHIGDTINQSLDESSLRALIKAIKEANESTGGKVYQNLQSVPLEIVKVDSDAIDSLNSNLKIVDRLDDQGNLTSTQRTAFLGLKKEIHSLNEFDQKLEELHYVAKSLLQETRLSLKEKIRALEREPGSLLDGQSPEALERELECKTKELEVLEDFINELDDAGKIADWIDGESKSMAKRYGRKALRKFPDIEKYIDPEKISDFCFSIYQFLQQVSHCLRWGSRNILDNPEIPLVLDYTIYEEAFSLVQEEIDENAPSRFSQEIKNLARECIDYLIFQLPLYD